MPISLIKYQTNLTKFKGCIQILTFVGCIPSDTHIHARKHLMENPGRKLLDFLEISFHAILSIFQFVKLRWHKYLMRQQFNAHH